MNVFLVLSVAIAAVSADVSSLGYQYNAPQQSFNTPSYQSSSSNIYNTKYTTSGSSGNGYNYKGQSGYQGVVGGQQSTVGIGYQSGSAGNGYSGSAGNGYSGSAGNGYSGSAGNGYSGSAGSGYSGSSGTGYQTGSAGTGYQSGTVGIGYQSGSVGTGYQSAGLQSGSVGSGYQGSSYQGSAYQSSGSAYQAGSNSNGLGLALGSALASASEQGFQYQKQQVQVQQGPAQVFKHYYVHAAPEEPEVAKARNPIVLPPAQKHYKIIFIKTPSTAGGASQVVPVQPQSEEKTIVYVLVKKPDEYQDVAVPKIEQKPPSKPEVYFIKYKNKEDSQAVINNIVSDYNKGQQTVSFSGIGSDSAGAGSGLSGATSLSGSSGALSGSSGQSESSGYSGSSSLSGGSGYVTSGLSGSSGLSGASALSGGSGYSGVSSQSAGSGSYSGQYDLGSGSSTSSGLTFGQETGGQVATSFGSTGFSSGGSVTPVTISKSEPLSTAVTVGYDSSDLSSGSVGIVGASSTASYDVNTIGSVQGVPHETYGIPSFKS